MTFQRHFNPDAAVTDELVEVLYQLLMDVRSDCPEAPDVPPASAPESTCFPDPNE